MAFLLAGLALLFFWPRGEDVRLLMLQIWHLARSWGLPAEVSPEAFSALANGLVFVPLTFVFTVSFRQAPPYIWALSGFVIGAGIELVQMFLLGSRVPEAADAVANGLGGIAGALLGAWVVGRSSLSRRHPGERWPLGGAGPERR